MVDNGWIGHSVVPYSGLGLPLFLRSRRDGIKTLDDENEGDQEALWRDEK